VSFEAGADAAVPGGFVVPAASFGVGLQRVDVVELGGDRVGGGGSGTKKSHGSQMLA
jgi:hypothetical protein